MISPRLLPALLLALATVGGAQAQEDMSWLAQPKVAPLRNTLPSGWSYLFDASDVDGAGNATVADGTSIASWESNGSLGDAAAGATLGKPLLRKKWIGRSASVSFDGTQDYMPITNSATDLAYLHTTGIFTIILVYRASGALGSMIGSTAAVEARKGFCISIEMSGTNTRAVMFLDRGVSGNIFRQNLGYTVPIGTWTAAQFTADGTKYGGSYSVNATPTTAFANPLTTGDAYGPAALGSGGPATGSLWMGDIAFVGIWPVVLDAGQLAQVRSALNSRFNLGLP